MVGMATRASNNHISWSGIWGKGSKRLVVFAASPQWADAVKVVSRGTPRSRTSVTWGIRWSVSAAEKERHEHLLGLVGPISPPRPRRKKVRRKGGLIGIAEKPFSRHLQKGKQNHQERRVDHLYITEKVMGQ